MKYIIAFIIFCVMLITALTISGCDEQQQPPKSITTELKTDSSLSGEIKILFLKSEGCCWWRDEQEIDLINRIERFSHSNVKIVKVNTIYSNLDGNQILTGAEIYYK